MSDKPAAHAKRWTQNEDDQLLKYIDEKLSHDEIAEKHQRTAGAIKSRLCGLAYNMHKNGENIESISNKFKVSIADLELSFKRKDIAEKNKNEKKETAKKLKEAIIEHESIKNKLKEDELKKDELKEITLEIKEMKLEIKEMRLLMQKILKNTEN
jgi:hypothetical protein